MSDVPDPFGNLPQVECVALTSWNIVDLITYFATAFVRMIGKEQVLNSISLVISRAQQEYMLFRTRR